MAKAASSGQYSYLRRNGTQTTAESSEIAMSRVSRKARRIVKDLRARGVKKANSGASEFGIYFYFSFVLNCDESFAIWTRNRNPADIANMSDSDIKTEATEILKDWKYQANNWKDLGQRAEILKELGL